MKYILSVLTIVWLLAGCRGNSTSKSNPDDSLTLGNINPAAIDSQTYNRYYPVLDHFFDSLLIKRGFNGGILVAKNGQILYEKYVGYRDLKIKDSLTDTTSFHLASTSKPFTAMALLRLIQDGRLSLEDSIQKFFP